MEIREQPLKIIEKLLQKGAQSPETAMTAKELSLPAEFKERIKRRLGRSSIFIEVYSKYYLSEEQLWEVKDKIADRRRTRSW